MTFPALRYRQMLCDFFSYNLIFDVSRYYPLFLIFCFALKMPFDRSLNLRSSPDITDVNPWGQADSEKVASFSPCKSTFLKYWKLYVIFNCMCWIQAVALEKCVLTSFSLSLKDSFFQCNTWTLYKKVWLNRDH